MAFILEAIVKILAGLGIFQIGSWAVKKSSGSSTGGSGSSGTPSNSPTILGDVKLWGVAVIVVGGFMVIKQYLIDKRDGVV